MKFFFLIGPPKTGTTLLARLIDRHPEACCINESHSMMLGHEICLWHQGSPTGAAYGFSEERVALWDECWAVVTDEYGSEPDAIPDEVFVPVFKGTMMDALTDFGKRCFAGQAGDKWPFYLQQAHWPKFRSAFAGAKLIYTTRDPRGILVSAVGYDSNLPQHYFVRLAINQDEVLYSDPAFDELDVLRVRFEDLVSDPNGELGRVWEHLGLQDIVVDELPWTDPFPGRWHIKNATKEIDPGVADKWRQIMDEDSSGQVASVAAAYMQRHGYER